MATDVNPAPLPMQPPPTGGYKVIPLVASVLGASLRGLWRGFGGPTPTNGADTTSPIMHMAVAETYDDAWDVQNVTANSTAQEIGGLSNRKALEIYNEGPNTVYIGPDDDVTATAGSDRGRPIPPGAAWVVPVGPTLTVFAICASGQTAALSISRFA